jgi:hypothetical protein
VFILDLYFASKSFAAVCEAVCNLARKYCIRPHTNWLYNFGTQEVLVSDKCSLSFKTVEITAILISSSASAVTVGYGCKNSILLLVSLFSA